MSTGLQSPKFGLWAVGFFVFAVLRSGVRRTGDHAGFVEAVGQFPNISTYWRTSIVPLVVAKVLGVSSTTGWLVLHGVVTVAVLVGLAIALHRRIGVETSVVLFGLVVFGSLGTVLFGGIGFYDVWVIAGALILVLGPHWFVRLVGALLLLGGNFELGCAALLSYSVWVAASGDRRRFGQTVVVSGAAIVAMYGVITWIYRNAPDSDSRGEWLVDQAKGSLVNAIVVLPLLLFSFFGITWLIIGRHILDHRSLASKALACLGLLIIPAATAALTLDGTRVFVTVAAPATIAVLLAPGALRPIGGLSISPRNLAIAALVIPATQIHMGEVIKPFAELYGRLDLF